MNKKQDIALFVAIGAILGGIITLFFAPAKGSETRQKAKNSFDDLIQKIKNFIYS